jgi:hypothetical protein
MHKIEEALILLGSVPDTIELSLSDAADFEVNQSRPRRVAQAAVEFPVPPIH